MTNKHMERALHCLLWGNAYENHNGTPPYTQQDAMKQEGSEKEKGSKSSAGLKCREILVSMHIWWGGKRVQLLWNTVWQVLRRVAISLPYNPAIPLLAIYVG